MKYSFLASALIFSGFCFSQTITISEEVGFNAENSTNFVQFAIDQAPDTVVIDNVGQPWILGPINVFNSDLTIIFEEGVVVHSLTGAYDIYDPMFRIRDVENITILGYGATIEMNKQEFIDLADESEWRHAFNVQSVVDFRLEGIEVKDSGGDGVILGKSFQQNSNQNFCENVIIRNCIFDNNYRQGMTISSVKNCLVENCIMKNTIGTLPEAGIDIEPDVPDEILQDVVIRNCQFINNNGNGIMLALFYMDDTSEDISITIEDCYFQDNFTLTNEYAYAEIACLDNNFNGVDGEVNFNRCYVSSSQFSPVYVSKTVESYDLNFSNCVFKNVSQDPVDFNNPIFFEVTSYDELAPRTGGVTFTDCRVDYAGDFPFFTYIENLPTVEGLGDVTGNFFVANGNAPAIELGANPENVSILFEDISGTVSEGVEIEFLEDTYVEDGGAPMIYGISREGTEPHPLGVEFEFSGDAQIGLDYALHPPFSILAANQNETLVEIDIVNDAQMEADETVVLTLLESACYSFGNNVTAQTIIVENNTLSISHIEEVMNFKVYPNPTTGLVQLDSNDHIVKLEVFSSRGRKIMEFQQLKGIVDLENLPNGLYFLKASSANASKTLKLIKE
jgi:hypothetical protein